MYYIYQIQFPNGKVRIGQTNNIKNRINNYKKESTNINSKQYNSYISKAIRKYNLNNCLIVIITTCDTQEKANLVETFYIQSFCAFEDNCGYNIEPYADRKVRNPETNAKISKAMMNNKNNVGRIYSDKERHKLSESRLGIKNPMYGKKLSDVRKKQISEFHKGNKYNIGRKHTEETKQKMREASYLSQNRPDVKEKKSKALSGINNPMYGKKHSEETKQKMREACFGRKRSEETKQKMREAWKKKKIRCAAITELINI